MEMNDFMYYGTLVDCDFFDCDNFACCSFEEEVVLEHIDNWMKSIFRDECYFVVHTIGRKISDGDGFKFVYEDTSFIKHFYLREV